ncbi:MAG: type II toxin-antitoxin system VapC family toxin [Candidatus Binatia bacterium]
MKLLLDTHTLLWAVDDPMHLGPQAVTELQAPTNELLLSAGSIWELAIKVGAKKLALSLPYRQWILQAISDLGLTILPITVEHANVQTELFFHHRDPFDRLLVAQSLYEQIAIVSVDPQLDVYGVTRIW